MTTARSVTFDPTIAVWSAGGKEVTPWRFLGTLSWRSRILESLRTLAVKVFGAGTHYCTASRAYRILSASEPRLWPKSTPATQFLQGGLDPQEMTGLQSLPERCEGPCRLVQDAPGLLVTLDPARLAECNKIVVTSSTILNGSLDRLLPRTSHAAELVIVGPSATCLPPRRTRCALTSISTSA